MHEEMKYKVKVVEEQVDQHTFSIRTRSHAMDKKEEKIERNRNR